MDSRLVLLMQATSLSLISRVFFVAWLMQVLVLPYNSMHRIRTFWSEWSLSNQMGFFIPRGSVKVEEQSVGRRQIVFLY